MNDHAPTPDAAPIHLVDSEGSVASAARVISAQDMVALDTEFHAERRYHPEFMLLQVCAPDGQTWLADPRACEIGSIIRAVSTRRVVVHAGQADLGILQREADTAPHDLLDVQIGSAMIGLGYPTRLDTLTRALLDRPLAKQATLSDWSRRPLQPEQIEYAASDVRILIPLSERVRRELEARGRLPWAMAASEEMATRCTRPPSTKHHWTDWEIAASMDPATRATMQAVFEWRDARGRDKDQPPHYMLSDGLALDVARRRPKSVDALQANRRIPGGLVRRYGQEIVRVVAQAGALDLEPVDVPSQAERQAADALQLWAAIQAETSGIAAALAMPRRVALAVARGGAEALVGWRAEALGEGVSAFVAGRTGVFLGPGSTQVR